MAEQLKSRLTEHPEIFSSTATNAGSKESIRMQSIYFIFFLMLLLGCKKTTEMDTSSNNKMDTTNQHLFSRKKSDKAEVRKDSIRIEVEDENGVNGADFKNWFTLDDSELKQVKEIYNSLKENHPDSTLASRESYADLVNNWVPLEDNNGKLSVSSYCELQKRWILADSMLIRFFQDGPAPSLILAVKKENNEYYIATTRGTVRFKLVDTERQIYSFNDSFTGDIYVIPVDRIKNFPVKFHECDEYE